MSFAEDLRTVIDATAAAYEAAQGSGPDAYFGDVRAHPMADGKYLSVLATLHKTRLISAPRFAERVNRVCLRLECMVLHPFKGGACWGLGFSWRNLPNTEPFLITSALVARGLLDCYQEGLRSDLLMKLLGQAQTGLEIWGQEFILGSAAEGDVPTHIPVYSPGIPEPVFNAAVCALSTLSQMQAAFGKRSEPETLRLLEWIRSCRVTGLGWTYSPNNLVVDLLHQCYILRALADVFGVESIESATTEMLGQFAAPCCFADSLHLIKTAPDPVNGGGIRWLRPLGNAHVELLPKPARLWSLGELLVLLSQLGARGQHADAWMRMGRQIVVTLVGRLTSKDDKEAGYPRQAMHALHGLASHLALSRKRAQ